MILVMDYISTGEAAKRLNVHPQTVRDWIRSGSLPAVRNPGPRGHYRVSETAVRNIEQGLIVPAEMAVA